MKTTELMKKLRDLNYGIDNVMYDYYNKNIIETFDVFKQNGFFDKIFVATINAQDIVYVANMHTGFKGLLNKQEKDEFINLLSEFDKTELVDRN